jgi:hypothetical protein
MSKKHDFCHVFGHFLLLIINDLQGFCHFQCVDYQALRPSRNMTKIMEKSFEQNQKHDKSHSFAFIIPVL